MRYLLLFLAIVGWKSLMYGQVEAPYGTPNDESLPSWVRMMYADPTNLEEIQTAFTAYYSAHSFVKNGHTQYLKRILRERETYHFPFTDPSLSAEDRQELKQAEQRYLQAHQQEQGSRSGSWTSLGPYDWDHDAEGRSYAPGAAHVYTVEQCSQNSSTMYAGTATAGLWKSTNRGASWTNVTKDLMANQVYAVEINPANCSDVLAAMMGGIYRSTNGGTSWTETGNAAFQSLDLSTDDIKYVPGGGTVWAATNEGLFYSVDNGANWTEEMDGAFQEIEFHPGNSMIMYVIRQTGDVTEFYKSTNGGTSFVQQTTGWPAPSGGDHNRRAEIAVTPDAPNRVYALLTGEVNGGSGLFGIYISNDSGASWSFNCCGPQPGGTASATNINMMGWSDIGTDNGGQFYYDLALAVSPDDADKVFVAGVNLWVSEDGGNSFTCPAKWSHPYKPNYVHADVHDINFYENGDLWLACDGGIFYSTNSGASFDRSMNGITGSDFWGFGVGFNNEDLMLGGAYHNGTLIRNGNVYESEWACMDGGDGVGGAVNPFFENQVYSNYNIKTMPDDRTTAPATRNYAREPSWTYVSGRFSQIEFAGDNYNVHYFGDGSGLYKTEDDNKTVTLLYDFGEEVGDVEVSWTDPAVMYVATFPGHWTAKKIYRSTDGGSTWSNITPAATAGSGVPYDIEVSYEDPDLIWAARIGRNSGTSNQVLRSTNGGSSWSDITSNVLNGEVLTNIITQRGANDHLYLGTTRTVYHSSGGSGWQLFADGLPASARSRQLAIGYRTGTLYNATNRSVWASDLAVSSAREPQIAVDKYYSGCARDTFKFADYSTAPASTSFQWSFPGASWVSSTTTKDPEVVYGNPGSYTVSLTVNGATQTLTNFIEVGEECSPDPFAGRALSSSNNSQHFRSDNELEVSSNTMTLMAWVKPAGIQDAYTGIIFNDDSGAGMNFRPDNQLAYHWAGGSTHWAWNSGLYVPADEWSFVVMVITPNQITFYLNEQEVSRNFTTPLSPVYWGRFRVGRYQGRSDRNFKGEIDEAIIWNRALNREEIREWRHLTMHQQATPGDPIYDATMLAYLQFNENSSSTKIYDRAKGNHGTLNGNASLVSSSVPIGDGSSSRQLVDGGGSYAFNNESLKLIFPNSGTHPDGDIVITRLRNSPWVLPSDPLNTDSYWIVNNYGAETFSELTSIEFQGLSGVSSSASPGQFTLYKRPSNADDLPPWGDFVDQADAVATGGKVTFSTNNSITSFSQFILGRDVTLLPVDFLDMWLTNKADKEVLVSWVTEREIDADYFIVERSKDGRTFEAIQQLSASNNHAGNNYEYLDQSPLLGLSYYRIKAVDFAGETDYSPLRTISRGGGETSWANVFPNPMTKNGGLRLESNLPGNTIFELYTLTGRLVQRTKFENSAYLRLTGLPAGGYTYHLVNGTKVISGRLVN